MHTQPSFELTSVTKLNKDLIKLFKQGVPDREARTLVDLYYTLQDQRIELGNQIKAFERDAKKQKVEPEPHDVIIWAHDQFETLEKEIQKALKNFAGSHEMAWFFDATCGIGPIIAAGYIAYIVDIRNFATAGNLWSYAGLNPTKEWTKGQKRPWNARLKVLCWKTGQSFIKVKNNPNDFYGKIYTQRKEFEWNRNVNGGNADYIKAMLTKKQFSPSTDAYKYYMGKCDPVKVNMALAAGDKPDIKLVVADGNNGIPMLPPAQIDQRAARYAVKLFLSHLHGCWTEQVTGQPAPVPYIIAHGDHVHYIAPPQLASKQKMI